MRCVLAFSAVVLVTAGMHRAGELDALIQTLMARRQIVGLSLAIIDDGRIVETRAYGTTTRGGRTRVTPATLFQAGSISKPVSALGALRLVEAGKLSLDEDVNTKLTSWRVPGNELTTTERVTLRRLLSHTAGLTVHGFPGYPITDRIPSVPEVLDGHGNTAPVRVDVIPGSIWRYSGGGYTVMQQLVEDVSGKPFAEYMRDQVLRPLGMTNSTFQQPLPTELARRAATGYRANRSEVPGRWHAYPEMAAAGLWTTPTDLAKYAIGVQQASAGKSKVLSADMTRQMLTDHKNGQGLGPGVNQNQFGHNGRDAGFDASLSASVKSRNGLVVMINGNDNASLMSMVSNLVARKYKWKNYDSTTPEVVTPVDVPPDVLSALIGRYELQNSRMMVLAEQGGRVYSYFDGLPDEAFVLASDGRFVSTDRAVSFKLLRNAGDVEAVEWTNKTWSNTGTRRVPRIGPLFSAIRPSPDPDPSFSRNLLSVVQALGLGGKATAELPLLTAGARKQFTAPVRVLQGVRDIAFMHSSSVAGRGIARFGHPIQRVLYYRMDTDGGQRWLLLHVDANGLVADFDVVDN